MNVRHVAIIMDGNGRWAELRGLPRIEGHRRGVKKVRSIIDASIELRLEALTLYAFSMENWHRPRPEVEALMSLLDFYLKNEMKKLAADNIRFRAIGDIDRLPAGIKKQLAGFESITEKNTGLLLTGALSYGGREEILAAVKRIVKAGLKPDEIDEKTFESHLYTAGLPNPDLIIRTSGEKRLSNFLLWQSAYSELYFTETLWPDFGRDEFISAITEYQKRERRFGALPEVLNS
ncbi:MAG TPA: isoprenyl transferase [Nitrospirae bacterium]|nr:ditrans,polycis-undecaprenyl-diphosphate synthase [bacterium BMS3Abin10]GBE39749.1 ditrans,polycis-undecaprenyl-diphosphate synthase [bacterium BMS3Bbin08]HDH50915.1 isoprenyl transferase [Nitrospirota bacterium]HDK82095.1 isoprenyl transferase [Nitrospirota bacterium]